MCATDNQKNNDNNSKKDNPPILRAADIIPSENNKSQNKIESLHIPKFDLAQDIMAEHRKNSSTKRKGPNQSRSIDTNISEIKKNTTLQTDKNKIIAEIVARDIKRLCSSNEK